MDDSRHSPGDELWFGNSRLPRGQGVSEDAMYPREYVAMGSDGEEFRAPALVIPDLSKHEQYASKKYAGAGVTFYAGVPITTPRGYTIGVYSVTDDKPHEGLTIEELLVMVDMAAIVLHHLETIRNERARARGERLIQGMGTFIEGNPLDADFSMQSPGPRHIADPLDAAGARQKGRPKLHRGTPSSGSFKGLTISDANVRGREQYSAPDPENSHPVQPLAQTFQKPPVEPTRDPLRLSQKPKSQHAMAFDRAARILRTCLGADGVAFLDASSANLSKGTARQEGTKAQPTFVQHSQKKKTDQSRPRPQSALTPEDEDHELESAPTTPGTGEVSEKRQVAETIALALRDPSNHTSIQVTEHELRKLVRRHPQGRCYTFDADGKLAAGEDSATEELVTTDGRNPEAAGGEQPQESRHKQPKRNPLLSALPDSRTIVFLPLWDLANQRWNAAAVIWAVDPVKMMNVMQDFSYLRAFANSVMNEIARLNLSVSDAAKGTFLANISHELRSPLHGILGSIEFLHDTALDDFQSGMVISVETCGKTLLDTVNHVLDFAKLNNLSKSGGKDRESSMASATSHTPLTSTFDLAVVVEEGVEAVYAGQVFRTANQDATEGQGPSLSSGARSMATRNRVAKGHEETSDAVALTLNIDDGLDWCITSQPGAIRRIVMNLLGNALKYTDKGSINVSLELDKTRLYEEDDDYLHVCITVTDTGRGMSDDFVRNHAFTAFSQEDSLATGTGLGLSIIRSIVDSLGGKIDLRSQKDQGTEVKIWLSLPHAKATRTKEDDKSLLELTAERMRGKSICLLKPPENTGDKITEQKTLRHMPTVEDSLRNLLSQWFSLDIFTAPSMENIRETNFFIFAEPPPIEYLLSNHGEHGAESVIPVIIFCQNAFQASSLRANGIHSLTDIGKSTQIPC
jgi:signal transduction histidine kinase